MNLLVSYNWLKEYVKTGAKPEEFARRLSLSGPSVERIDRVGEGLNDVVVGKIVKVKEHPNADKLRVTETDIGGEVKDIVCGGSNLYEGQLVAVAKPGARVRWHGEGEPIRLEVAKIRGVESFGMIAAANEIGLFDMFPHDEREILDLSSTKAKPGTPVAKALGLEDVVFDVEVTTNRPDAYCMAGMAREAAAVLEASFLWKAPKAPAKPKGEKLPLKVSVKAKKLCPRYQALVMKNVKVGPSPVWLKRRLAAAGHNSINNVVDITNYVRLELGQPMHAFDHSKLGGESIVVREAKAGERLEALDGETYRLAEGQLVIADAERPVAVAGVMGGKGSGVTEATTAIVFESAAFEPVQVRRAARALNLYSDSQHLYEKGLSTELTTPALARAAELAMELCGAEIASEVFDVQAERYKPLVYPFRPEVAEALIGVKVPAARMKKILTSLGFKVSGSGAKWKVEVPYWRDHDIEGERDLVEEVARVYGYDNLPSVIPDGELPLRERPKVLEWEDRAKRVLKGWGHTELMTYSFVSEDMMRKAGEDPGAALKVQNPLSEDLTHMRLSLVPGVLKTVEENQDEVPEGRAFELSNVYLPRKGDLPEEKLRLAVLSWSRDAKGSDAMKAKGIVEALCDEIGLSDVTFEPASDDDGRWHPGRSVHVLLGGMQIGTVGEVHPLLLARFGVERRVGLADLDAAALLEAASSSKAYRSIPEFPNAKRDLAVVLDRKAKYHDVIEALRGAGELLRDAELFDVYEGKGVGEGKKSLAFHLAFGAADRTLEAKEVDGAMERIVLALKERFGAELR